MVAVRALRRRFGEFVAVDDVTFDVRPGEIFGFLGPNGAGKTTVIKMLAGLLEPTSGSATVAGHDVAKDPDAVRRVIGYMSQLFSLYGDLTVAENLSFFSGLYGVAAAERVPRHEAALAMARLTGERDRLVRELPLGFKQRLALGCATLHRPSVLFLDEPTSGVDPITRASFWDLIRSMARDGTTVFVTTHYLEEAEHCDRLALMNRGRLIALDTPRGLRERMTAPLLELRCDDAPRAARALRGVPEILALGLFGRAIHMTVREENAARDAVARTLAAADLPVRSVRRIDPSLEDVFIHLVESSGGALAN